MRGILNKSFYKTNSTNLLTNLYNIFFELLKFLKIKTKISFSKDFPSNEKKLERLIELCHHKNANIYLSGPLAANYIEEDRIFKSGLTLEYMKYKKYIYKVKNINHKFINNLSIIDLLMNEGSDSYLFFE